MGSASVIVPGMGDHRTPNQSQTIGAVNMKFGQGGANGAGAQEADRDSQKLSVIQEGETNNEISSVLEREDAVENVRSDGEDNKKKVPIADAIKTSVISEEDALEIMKRITQRNSMLQKSQNNSFAGANVPNKSMIDASIAPLVNAEVQDVMIVEEEDENVKDNSQPKPKEKLAAVLEQVAEGSPQ